MPECGTGLGREDLCVCLNTSGSTEELGVVPGARGLRRPFRELACPTPVGRKAAGEQSPPRLERGEGETSLRPGGPATRSLLRARGPSPAAPPSKASCK